MKQISIFLLACLAVVPAFAADRSIDEFFESFAGKWVRLDPVSATMSQYFSGEEQDALDRKLTPVSREFALEKIALAKAGLEELRTYDTSGLSQQQLVSYGLVEWMLDDVIREGPFLNYQYPFDQFLGLQVWITSFLATQHPLRNERDAENFIARLQQVGPLFDSGIEVAIECGDAGYLPPVFIFDSSIKQFERLLAPAPAESFLVSSFADRLQKVEGLSEEQRLAFVDAATIIVTESVNPAFERTLALLKEQRKSASEVAGVLRFPDGEAAYAHYLRRFTTVPRLTPKEVHEIGLAEVVRIEAQMNGILRSIGYDDGTVQERMVHMLADSPALKGDDPRAYVLAEYERVIADAQERCKELFEPLPKAPVVVKREPEFSEATAAAHYTPPAPDGSLPGIFWAPLPGPIFRESEVSRTLTYHETVPGHHLQVALQMETEDLPRFRQKMTFGFLSAYGEGWALYTERLAIENNWYEGDPRGLLVALAAELFRARRLVVDTGIHTMGWTRQQGIDYGFPASEIERYVVWPGQATSYKTGQLKILELRGKLQAALGDNFSIKKFHNIVLGSGDMPLAVLEQLVDEAIAEASTD